MNRLVIVLSVFLICGSMSCGEGVIGTEVPDIGDSLHPNPDRLILSVWDDDRPWEVDNEGNHYLAIENGGSARIVASYVRYSDEVEIDGDEVEWRSTGTLLINTDAVGRTLEVAANVDAITVADLDGSPATREPETLILAIYRQSVVVITVKAIVNATGRWTFSIDGERKFVDVKQIGRDLSADDPSVYGEVTKDGLQLIVGDVFLSGVFRTRDHVVGAFVRDDGTRGDFVGRKHSAD